MSQVFARFLNIFAFLCVAAAVLAPGACSPQSPAPPETAAAASSEADGTDDYRQLKNILQDLQFAYEAKDVDGFAIHVAADFSLPDGDRSAFLESIRESMSLGERFGFEDTRISIDGTRAEVADFTVSGGEVTTRMTLAFEKREGAWLLTSVAPPEEEPQEVSQIVVDTAPADLPAADNWMSPIVTRNANPSSGELPDVEDPAAANQPIADPQY